MKSLRPPNHFLWLVAGDFNEVLFFHEKIGRKQMSEALMENFREAFEFCSLQDVGLSGDYFNWSNKHKGDTSTKERLDWAVANSNSS